MTPAQEDQFQSALQGDDFGDIDDWEFNLGEKILHTRNLLHKNNQAEGEKDPAAQKMMRKKLDKYTVALDYLQNNPKAATTIGAQGGLRAVMAYLEKQAKEDATADETRAYSNRLKAKLPGVRLLKSIPDGGFDRAEEAVLPAAEAVDG